MYIIIVGCSEIGYHLAKLLLAAGHEVLVIEKSLSRYQMLWDELGSVVMLGDGTDEPTLRKAGAARADVLIAAANRDEVNLVACQVGRHRFEISHTMAVVNDHKNDPIFHILGVDVAVNSTHLVLNYLEEGIPGRPLLHLMDLPQQNLEIVSIAVPSDAMVVGKRLGEIELPPHSFVSLVIKHNRAELPAPELVIDSDDEVVLVTSADEEHTLYDILTGV